jgi:ribosomal protein L40E
MAEKRQHFLISNRAFTKMTGVKKVCMDCGAADPPKGSECPGKRPEKTDDNA